jgi:hypothetical protein
MPKGKGKGAEPRKKDREKTLRADNGRVYCVSTILACQVIGERSCRALIHKGGWVTFSGRSFDRMPGIKFNHCTSKFFGERGYANEQEGAAQAAGVDGGGEHRGAAKARRATYFEEPLVRPGVDADAGGVAADGSGAAGAGVGADPAPWRWMGGWVLCLVARLVTRRICPRLPIGTMLTVTR